MTLTTTPSPFWLRWYDHDHDSRACWYIATTSTFTNSATLPHWQIPAQHSTIYLCTNLSETMFARIIDTGNGVAYGAKFNTSTHGCNMTIKPVGALEMEAGNLISDDPKIQIKQGGTTTPCAFTWDGRGWSYSINRGAAQEYDCVNRPTIQLTTADPTLPITIVDSTHGAGRAAIYHPDPIAVPSATTPPSGTAVGLIDACEIMPGRGEVTLQVAASETATYTLNLFVNRETRLALAPPTGG